jgi:hypothetical protein
MSIYFHGGPRRLKPGGRILPPDQTGALTVADLAGTPADMQAQIERVHRRDRVYLTTNYDAARLWAGLHPDGDQRRGGSVYRVQPEGAVELDPDHLPGDGEGICCPSALILAVAEVGVLRAPYVEALPYLADQEGTP